MAAVKALQQWCKIQCDGYRDVSITNMTTSFRDGLAFCALIHKHRPDLINFDSLKKEDVYDNNKLAFRVAEEELGIPALLDAEDMVALKIPDRLSILTYVSQYYNYFHGRSPIGGMAGIKRPADGSTDEPSGKKNQPVVSKMFPSSRPAMDSHLQPSSQITNPKTSPKQASRATQKEVSVEKSHQTGTLSNKCVSCNKHVHLVQRHLVDGKLYHRNCARSLFPSSTNSLVRELPQTPPVPKYTPHLDNIKVNTTTPTPTPNKLGPVWLSSKTEKSSPSPSQPASVFSSPGRGTQTTVFHKPASTTGATRTTCDPTVTTTSITFRPNASPKTPRESTLTTSITTSPRVTPQTSATAAKTQQAKLRFLQTGSDTASTNEENKTPGLNVVHQNQGVRPGQAVSVVVNLGGVGSKDLCVSGVTGGNGAKASGLGGASGKLWSKEENSSSSGSNSKTQAAAAFISKKLTEENNNNNSKPPWTTGALKKTDKPSQVEPTKKETVGIKGRVKLKVNPSLLADLSTQSTMETPKSTPTPGSRGGVGARTPVPPSASTNTSVSENSDSPAEWRSKLKPVSKETKPAALSPLAYNNKPTDVSSKPWTNEAGKSLASDSNAGLSTSHPTSSSTHVTIPPSRGFLNGGSSLTTNGTKPEQNTNKIKPDYIPKEQILKELQEIEDNLNELEKTGVELEVRLRRSEEEGEDDSVMDELMVDWFNLIRNKQVAMRRESELVYIAKNQDLEEQQPSVEQELRKLMDKPDHLKTSRDRKREEELMAKLVEIVNDRNAIVEGLDEDRLREEEEDEQLNKMMMNFDMKKDKQKKKSPMSKLFSWGNKKGT
ncbi:MICAL-like protein 2 [Myripristis murdjan]|uniref:Mical-like 2b n=1 Tax=Myripristis murdjan TaxID=586833 RepID=A0A668A2J0_9TELE|nr:MICAL-like protein 2 [Myripristis murdjan]